MDNSWLKLDIFTTTGGAETVCAALTGLGINGFQITDAKDLEDFLNRSLGYWDYYDESLLSLRDAETTVTAYIPGGAKSGETLAAVSGELDRLKALDAEREWGRLALAVSGVREEDWAFAWKKYYHPVKVGERLVVCPSWETYEPENSEVVIKLDPGMAFGTGTHESTRLCLRLAERFLRENARVLDLGSGSGILSIAAVLLGASSAEGIDIDDTAVRVANENAALNGVSDKCVYRHADLSAVTRGCFDLVFANIVADVIVGNLDLISGNVDADGVMVLSGIIDEREADVMKAAANAGLRMLAREAEGGWAALAFSRR